MKDCEIDITMLKYVLKESVLSYRKTTSKSRDGHAYGCSVNVSGFDASSLLGIVGVKAFCRHNQSKVRISFFMLLELRLYIIEHVIV